MAILMSGNASIVEPAPPPFDPVTEFFGSSEAGGLWDFTDSANLYTDTARTTNVSADGDNIRGVTDLSGNGNHLTQTLTDVAQQPNWRPAESAAEWTGGESLDAPVAPRAAGQTLAARYRHGATDPGNVIGSGDGAGNSYIDFGSSGVAQMVVLNDGSSAILSTDDGGWHTIIATWVNTDLKVYLDGEKVFDGVKLAVHGAENYNIGSRGQFGVYAGAFNGEISNAMIRDNDTALSDDQARNLHNEWMGTSIVAPSGAHRYWRLAMRKLNVYIELSQIELRASVSGADETTSGTTITSNSVFSGSFPVTNLTNENLSNSWSSESGGANPIFITVDFGSGVTKEIVEVALRTHTDASYIPEAFLVQYSDDNTNWTTSWSVTDPAMPSTATYYAFARP